MPECLQWRSWGTVAGWGPSSQWQMCEKQLNKTKAKQNKKTFFNLCCQQEERVTWKWGFASSFQWAPGTMIKRLFQCARHGTWLHTLPDSGSLKCDEKGSHQQTMHVAIAHRKVRMCACVPGPLELMDLKPFFHTELGWTLSHLHLQQLISFSSYLTLEFSSFTGKAFWPALGMNDIVKNKAELCCSDNIKAVQREMPQYFGMVFKRAQLHPLPVPVRIYPGLFAPRSFHFIIAKSNGLWGPGRSFSTSSKYLEKLLLISNHFPTLTNCLVC